MFKIWAAASDLPASAEILLLGGLLKPTVAELAAFFNFLMGWLGLTALLSATNLRRVFIDFFRPLTLIDDPQLRRFFMAPATVIFSLAVVAVGGLVAGSTWVVELRSTYELVAELESGDGVAFLNADGDRLRNQRLDSASATRILLAGPGSEAILLLRDKYGFRTLDAVLLRRTLLGFDILPCSRGHEAEATSAAIAATPRDLEVLERLRWSWDTVRVPLVLPDGRRSESGWLLAGDGRDGPERGAPDYAQRFLDWLFQSRNDVAAWYRQPAYADSTSRRIEHRLAEYDMSFTFEVNELLCGERTRRVSDARVVTAVEKPERQGER